ncbi:MAG: hypothetical protein BMS9Abin12_0974 [Acidimicrobiia bacterium]|nr:MAG: hypothetical protein BMS9Abin12_0974 [Acidimicrobiia bacterium]
MTFVRILLGALLGVLVLVVAFPAVVLIDLVSGGTGLGLCREGLGTCSAGVYAGAELLVVLSGIIVVLALFIALCLRILRRSQRTA